MNLPYIITEQAITVVIGNRPKTVSSSHMHFAKLAAELRKVVHDVDMIADLSDISMFVAKATFGEVQIADGSVRWRGKPVKNIVAERLIDMLKLGHDLTPLANFLDRVMANPSSTAHDELFLWLESGSQPITPEGMILAYKHVRGDYKDHHTGTFDNSVGQAPEMKREDVDPDRDRECSRGLHFCSFPYLSVYTNSRDSHTMIVLVDPANVVAIPRDYNNQKGRCWTYQVVGEVAYDAASTFFANCPVVEVYVDTDETSDEDVEMDDPDQDNLELNEDVYYDPFEDMEEDFDTYLTEDDGDGDDVAVQVEGKGPLLFHRGSRSILATELLDIVKSHGQRGASRMMGIPRTTIQEWIKAINNQ